VVPVALLVLHLFLLPLLKHVKIHGFVSGFSFMGPSATHFFFELTPERVLDAVERLGVRCTGRVMALNSMENRVYEVELDLDEAPLRDRWEAYRVVKFYRPGRWTKDQILEEHQFLSECQEAEIPVVAPIEFPDGSTVAEVGEAGIFYSVFPKVGGRILDEMTDSQLRQIGRLLARLHAVGARHPFAHRATLSVDSYGRSNIAYLREGKFIPSSVEAHYSGLAERIFSACEPWFAQTAMQRLHGDCHIGNLLWSAAGCSIVDFDDALAGPCVQDLWLLTPGREAESQAQREQLLEGYEMMRTFDRTSLRLIEPLRALRMIHFTAWIARRYEDPAFKRVFVDFGSEGYWREQLIALQEVGESIGVG
jgi:Ser/Thr protein kinase RdoA (MazF antagonist)